MRAWLTRLAPPAVVLLLAAPMIVTDRGFSDDWINHLWFAWREAEMIRAEGTPSLFLDSAGTGILYPWFAFYGGTLYSVTGYLAVLFGGRIVPAYVAVSVGALAAAYGGWTWLARLAGLRGWVAQVPAFVWVTSAYYLTVLYGRGAWPEFVAVSMLPVIVASGVRLLRDDRLRLLPAAAWVAGVGLLAGSHNLTLLWGGAFLALLAGAVVAALPGHGRGIGARRVMRLAGLGALAAGVSLWHLLPTLAYSRETAIGQSDTGPSLRAARFLVDPDRLLGVGRLTPLELRPEGYVPLEGFFVEIPVLVLAWIAAALLAGAGGRLSRPWRRTALAIGAVALAVLVPMWSVGALEALPRPFELIQFQYRLLTYVNLSICGLLLVLLLALRGLEAGPRRALERGLVVVVCVTAVTAFDQVVLSAPRAHPDRSVVFDPGNQPPRSQYGLANYLDRSEPVVRGLAPTVLAFDARRIEDGSLRAQVDPPSGPRPFVTNLLAARGLVEVSGLRRVGRTPDGRMVLARPRARPQGPLDVELSTADSLPVLTGRYATFFCLGALAVLAVAGGVREVRLRGRRPA